MTTLTLLAADAQQMMNGDRGDGPEGFWPIFPILWLLIIGGIVTTVVLTRRRNGRLAGPRAGEAKLAERFASGEINEQEYRDRLGVLKGQTK